ncbi:chromosome segregation protein SMC [Flavisolibacter ginsengisoli]|uniref:Chromosome partition protein Smc n=1 Tax=Flavisolibacter ginsengisoli DSM 18119 TaxID=1121884 RepID=A0A1M4WYQ2_9BACT|nr:chromosome segregation protein SMC [Flavisolibacter ginsengisoli]SHE86386.1 condensin subunit Smc [Flavisolibacter ginsengisoli DSM 18119]
MRLKSLEIKGFKSFADKTLVSFDENITGIVGPNGCGKSNIVDSIRWVIGEQKISHLRSENLESLVFNGSKTRSASGLAEVSLTFENTKNLLPTEFTTITITRKFYKNGESEYRLNDVQCRLKDIQNLFMDTGISTDSYAIIELGMVDDLIKDKENSRRRMLEQAAGISIYKTRKKEAKQKLDATEQDLARIEDLLFEINNQLKTLENQAKKAQKYYEIKKDYREISIELAKAALEGFNLTFRALNEQHDTETDKRIALEALVAGEEASLEQERVGFITREKELHTLQQGFNELVQTVRTRENEKNLAAQRLEYLKERETNLTQFLGKAEGQITGIDESINFTKQQLGEEEQTLESLTGQLEELRSQVDARRNILDENRNKLNNLRSSYQQVQRSQFDAEKKVAVADTSIQNLQRTIFQLEEEKANRQDQIQQLEIEKEEKQKALEARQVDLEQLQQHHNNTKEQILQTQAVLEGLRSKLAEETRKLDSKRNEHDLLKSLIDSMEGYPESVKFLHNNNGWNHKAPILSDIIYVKEEFRAAVENVLEPYLNYYVVNDLKEGLQAVHLLDDNKKGKANFFLLDKVNDATPVSPAHLPGDTIPALDVIEVDEQYRKLAEQLLSNVFIANDDSALVNSNGFVILEKHGKYVKGSYTLSGGSVGLFEGKKIGRAKNLEKLREQIASQKLIVDELNSQIQARHNEVITFNADLKENVIRQTEQEIQQLNNQLYGQQNKLENLNHSQATAQNRIEDLQSQLDSTHGSIENVRNELTQLNQTLSEYTAQLQEAETAYRNIELEYNEINTQYNNLNLQVTREQSKITALKQELNFKSNQLNDLKSQVELNTVQLKETTENITSSQDNLKQVEEGLFELMRRKEDQEHILNEADQAYYNLRNQLAAKESELRHKVKEKEQIEHLLSEIKDKLTDVKLQLAGMKERLNVEFRIVLEDILDEPRNSETPVEELQEKSDRMKKRLENLGEVNPTAIEAFEEMKKRYEFIVEQKDDLVNAKQSLLQTIAEVETTANQKFLETFNQVRENFRRVFKSLFTEDDQCDLILDNPDNLAETGIDIMAKPKGKRPSSIGQLSGGERTLTATALLFAIYLIKPAPFCILDEVDAPLDDANVGKFTNMIREFSNNSQFIIVTHNKTTMSTVDVIYGVTMQEPGVSKLVPVDFRSLN